ncbi:hypothetical protein A2W14_03855 [Candidatus Gottesmanbacteria bacterium RBG_16_37_8]|uniref:Antitoxin n=1 Tax=Candidatus Gottesmanbacteria bacterium RBG_16_37_8 TaxID=1798371 RepID=A0A1F5YTY1_9BACT|nr:MAG: hypothetical protein A2W14_03855 [Candidatus Gottesmanbacteria bacterium RBG_16_37_8]
MQPTQTVTIKELRDNLAQLIEEVAIAGKQIEITKFGKKKAVLVPVAKGKRANKKYVDFSKLPAFGMWKDRKDIQDSAKWVSDLRRRESTRSYER